MSPSHSQTDFGGLGADWMGHASVEETEGYPRRDRARHARAVNHLDAYVTV
jgi:hypothetical protein